MANDNTITRPELWTLILGLEPDRLQYFLYTDAQSDSLMTGEVKLELAGKTYLKAVEDAVYDTPLLLDDYKSVKVLYRADHFVLLPPEFGALPDDAAAALEASLPESNGRACLCHMPQVDACIVFEMPDDVANFMQRTFNNPPVFQHLYPLCRHFAGTCRDSGVTRMFINFHSASVMDIVVFDKARLAFANSFSFTSLKDAQYFILHAWHSLKLNVNCDEILVTGDKNSRNAIMPALRRFVNYVMPTIFPAAAMRLGDNAVAAPFELLTLALCE